MKVLELRIQIHVTLSFFDSPSRKLRVLFERVPIPIPFRKSSIPQEELPTSMNSRAYPFHSLNHWCRANFQELWFLTL